MKKLLGIVVLGLFLITPSLADDIRDFEIEGISIGDSLLMYAEEKDIIEDVIEPYLMQQGLVQRTARGRILSDKGVNHIKLTF